jgi:alpha-N-arabinofuranosidase
MPQIVRTKLAPFAGILSSGGMNAPALFALCLLIQNLQAQTTNNLSVRISREPLVEARINPLQYGQFVEYLCDLVPSMWAERLYDGGFEGLSPYKFAFIRETDFKEKPWYPSGAVNRANYSLDNETKISGSGSKKIEVTGGAPCTVGISQDGIFLNRDEQIDFSCWLRATRIAGPVGVSIEKDGRRYAACEFQPDSMWKKFHAKLKTLGRNENATLTIQFRGPGTLWVDNVSLMPTATVGGWRRDVVEAVRALKPGVIRFGGSALDEPNLGEFKWKDTVGDPDHRRPFRAWGGLQPTAAGLEEFVQFCKAVDAEPLICVRVSKQTPKDAAEEVEYFNGSASTEMGGWRARNGHPRPYGIKFWQVGNELSGAEYNSRVAAFCEAMKVVDPQIKLFSSFPSADALRTAGSYFDFVCPHHYSRDLAGMERNISDVAKLIRENGAGKPIKIAVTEWNTTAGDWGLGRATLLTLANALACSRYHNMLHRHCDMVEIANRSNLINSFCSGIIQVDNRRLYKTPTYYAQWLYSNLAGDQPLKIESESSGDLDISATRSDRNKDVTLFVVNDTSAGVKRSFDFSAWEPSEKKVAIWTLSDRQNAGEPDAMNSFADPERVAPRQSVARLRRGELEFTAPAYSLTALKLAVTK